MIAPIKRALLSVSDKTNIVSFANQLTQLNVEIISTGGTSDVLRKAQIPHRTVEALTALPSMLDGRVKTLHPKIHGGILGRRDQHAEEAKTHQIEWIDLVVVNFYPFTKVVNATTPWDDAIEYIDIGGPTMVRAAAKNIAWVGVVIDPCDYDEIIEEITEQQGLTLATRKKLASKVFALTSHYDAMIYHYLSAENSFPDQLTIPLVKHAELRYGENPHQKAYAYQIPQQMGLLSATQHQGKPLSYNNIVDAQAAFDCVKTFTQSACVIVKHANPCGVAISNTIEDAFARAYAADGTSAFGGIIALNRSCTEALAKAIIPIFMEVVVAPHFSEAALALFATKPNLRVLSLPMTETSAWEMKGITGGVLMQEKDKRPMTLNELSIVTQVKPTTLQQEALLFAWQVVKQIKSNAILIAKNDQTVGIGAGQVSRIDAVELAIRKAGEKAKDAVLASDAFFPFRDSIDVIQKAGVRAIIQPGGSVRDEEVIAACDDYGIAMVFTGIRCFKH